VNIYVTREIAFNIHKITEIQKKILGRLGCDGCNSGYDFHYKYLEDFVVNPENMEVKEVIPGTL